MPFFSAVTDFGLVFEYCDLLALDFSQRCSYDSGALNSWIAHKRLLTIANEQYLVKVYLIAFRYT
jgi:hypothetical protein